MLKLTSSAFSNQGEMPAVYAGTSCGEGDNLSPPLEWLDTPDGTQSLALIVQDPDAPRGTFTHWVAYDISPDRDTLSAGASNDGDFEQGRNSVGHAHYDGPCPPEGETHRYFFYLYALDVPDLGLGAGATAEQVRDALQGHVLEQAELIGRYGR